MKRRAMAMLAGVALLAALVAGCGGGGGSSEEALTKKQYVKQANAICAKEGKKISEGLGTFTKEHGGKTPSKAQTDELMEDVVIAGFQEEVDQLRGLPAPKGDEAKVEAILDGFETGMEEAGTDPQALFAEKENEFSKAREKATAYGLEGCGSLFF